jgi:hypothetical protein
MGEGSRLQTREELNFYAIATETSFNCNIISYLEPCRILPLGGMRARPVIG